MMASRFEILLLLFYFHLRPEKELY